MQKIKVSYKDYLKETFYCNDIIHYIHSWRCTIRTKHLRL